MKLRTIAAIAATGVALSGCATIITGSTQSIAINTPPTSGADCSLSNSEGTWNVASPGQVTVAKSKHDISVHCTKSGWQDADSTVASGFQAWTLGNIILGGLIGIGVDAMTGAINEYPKTVNVPMSQKMGSDAPPPAPTASSSHGSPTS